MNPPLTPACALDFPVRRSAVVTQQEKNKIRRTNIIEQDQFKTAAKLQLREEILVRSGVSEQERALILANDKLRIELARYMLALSKQRNNIRKLREQIRIIKAGKQPAQGQYD